MHDYILTHDYDIFAICETWFTAATSQTAINALLPPGYAIHHVDRLDGERGGGVALVYKQHMPITMRLNTRLVEFEYMQCAITLNKRTIDIFVVYRPPPSPRNGLSVAGFLEEWTDFLSHHTLAKTEFVLLGDINFHLEISKLTNTRNFKQTLEGHDLQQHIETPTHYCGHILDILISRNDSSLISDVLVIDIGLCNDDGNLPKDHYAITLTIKEAMPMPTSSRTSYRKYKSINIANLRSDIQTSVLTNTSGTVNELTHRYITGLTSLRDQHAPLMSRSVSYRPNAPWHTEPLGDSKRHRRRLERIWRLKKDGASHKEYTDQCCIRTRKLEQAKTSYYSNKISESQGSQKLLFKITNGLLSDQQRATLPKSKSDDVLATEFSSFFHEKIANLVKHFTDVPISQQPTYIGTQFTTFRPTTSEEVKNLINTSVSKTCDLDPLPTWLIKECLNELLPLLTSLFNVSFAIGEFPQDLKNAIIIPHLKHGKVDVDDLKNYRPVSNLQFISKILEKLIMHRLDEHLNTQNLHDPMQSAYKSNFSTETALMRLNFDILRHMDVGQCTILAALDLSAAFDTINHSLLLSRLQYTYGLDLTVLQWFRSYLTKRTQRVCINGSLSNPRDIVTGVPQGSVLGARLFTMYTLPISAIIINHNMSYNCYADDTQIYLHCENNTAAICEAIGKLEHCIRDVCSWMDINSLKINRDKTEFIIFNNKHNYTGEMCLTIGDDTVTSAEEVKILGITLDYKLTLDKQTTNTCRAVHIQTRKINSIRKYLTNDATKTIVQALATVRLDYCNGLYIGLSLKTINRLQRTQNTAARVVSRTSRFSHITPILQNLHWLPINRRSQFKILVLTYKSLHRNAPSYLCDILNWYKPNRHLRSAGSTSLVPNRHRTIRIGKRLFDTSAATLWNALPIDIKTAKPISTFKRLIKTFLYPT